MPIIVEDNDISTPADAMRSPTRRLVTEDKTDMPQFVQMLRRSLSLADSDVEAANHTNTPEARLFATEPRVRIPTPSPRPSYILISAPAPIQTNTETETDGASTMVSKSRPKPPAAPVFCPLEGSASARGDDGSRDLPRQKQLAEVLRLLESRERRYNHLEEQIIEERSNNRKVINMVQTLLHQDQPITSSAVANQSSPNASINMAHNPTSIVNEAMLSRAQKKREKRQEKRKQKQKQKQEQTDVAAPGSTANTNANKGKMKEIVHTIVVPVDTIPQRRMTKEKPKALPKAERKAAREENATCDSPLGFAPVRLSYN